MTARPHSRGLETMSKMARQCRDCAGLSMTCSSDEALQWYNSSLTAFATLRESPLPLVTKASELDPSMPLAHCLTVSAEPGGVASCSRAAIICMLSLDLHMSC